MNRIYPEEGMRAGLLRRAGLTPSPALLIERLPPPTVSYTF